MAPSTPSRLISIAESLQVNSAKEMRESIRQHMDELLGDDAVLMVPSAPGPAPILNTPLQKLNSYRASLISLTSIAGLAGLPQVWLFCYWLPSWRVCASQLL